MNKMVIACLCVIIIVVFVLKTGSSAFIRLSCVILSKAAVLSSKTIIGVDSDKALASAILCFCPPESLFPFSPIGFPL